MSKQEQDDAIAALKARYTRQDYMQGRVGHDAYYAWMAKLAGVSFKRADPAFLDRVRNALAGGDEHLNTIPLKSWDDRAASLMPSVGKAIRSVVGESDTLSVRVCLLKAAARAAVTGD